MAEEYPEPPLVASAKPFPKDEKPQPEVKSSEETPQAEEETISGPAGVRFMGDEPERYARCYPAPTGPMPRSDKEPHLLNLPGEIKNKIWGYCLANNVVFDHAETNVCLIARVDGVKCWDPRPTRLRRDLWRISIPHLGLFLTCKSIYIEVRDLDPSIRLVFCSQNCMELWCGAGLSRDGVRGPRTGNRGIRLPRRR